MAEVIEREDWTAPRFASAGGDLSQVVLRVREMISAVSMFDMGDVRPEDDLTEDLGFDTLDRLELLDLLEKQFGIEVSCDDADAWVTAGDVAAYVRDRFMKRPIP